MPCRLPGIEVAARKAALTMIVLAAWSIGGCSAGSDDNGAQAMINIEEENLLMDESIFEEPADNSAATPSAEGVAAEDIGE